MKKLILLTLALAANSLTAQNFVRYSPELNIGDRIEITNKKVLTAMEKMGIQFSGKIENIPDTVVTTTTLSVLESNSDYYIFDSKSSSDEISQTILSDNNMTELNDISPKIKLSKKNSQLSLVDSVSLMNSYGKILNTKIDQAVKMIDSLNFAMQKIKEKEKAKAKGKKKGKSEEDMGTFLEEMTMVGMVSNIGALVAMNDPEVIRLAILTELEPVFILTNCELAKNTMTKISSLGNSQNFGVSSYFQVTPMVEKSLSFETLTFFDTTKVDKARMRAQFENYLSKMNPIIDRIESEKTKPKRNIDEEIDEKVSTMFAEDPNLLVKKMNIEFNPETKIPSRIIIAKKQMIEPQGTEEEKAEQTMDTSATNIIDVKVIRK